MRKTKQWRARVKGFIEYEGFTCLDPTLREIRIPGPSSDTHTE